MKTLPGALRQLAGVGVRLPSVFLFCCISAYGAAQQSMLISGRVQDKDTGKPLARASVTIRGRTISTIANDQGAFSFYVPDVYKNDTLHVSAMGYESFAASLLAIDREQDLVIRLIPFALSLQEVVITETLAPEDILRLAIDKIRVNYYSTPYIQQAFYREVQQADGRYVSLIEAALKIYNKDHHQTGQHVKVLQLRKSKGHQHLTNPFWNTYNVLLSSQALNTVGYISKRSLREYTLKRQPDTTLDGKGVFVLTSATPEFWPIKFYIECDNFAFVRIEEMYDASLDGIKSWKQNNSDTVQVFPQKRAVILEYRTSPEKYSLSTLSFFISMIYKDPRSNKEILQFSIQQDLMVNDIQSVDVKPPATKEKLRRNLEKQAFIYDPDFWKSYNIIKETPLHERIREDLEKETPLEEQFKNNQMEKPSKYRN